MQTETYLFPLQSPLLPPLLIPLVRRRKDHISHEQQDDEQEADLAQHEALRKGQRRAFGRHLDKGAGGGVALLLIGLRVCVIAKVNE